MNSNKKVEVTEDFVLAVDCQNADLKMLEASAHIDLTEFNLSDHELEKLRLILKKLNYEILTALQKCSPAVSLITEIKVKEK